MSQACLPGDGTGGARRPGRPNDHEGRRPCKLHIVILLVESTAWCDDGVFALKEGQRELDTVAVQAAAEEVGCFVTFSANLLGSATKRMLRCKLSLSLSLSLSVSLSLSLSRL